MENEKTTMEKMKDEAQIKAELCYNIARILNAMDEEESADFVKAYGDQWMKQFQRYSVMINTRVVEGE